LDADPRDTDVPVCFLRVVLTACPSCLHQASPSPRMEPRGKLTDVIGTREGEGSGLVTCRDTCSTSSENLGSIPETGTSSFAGPSTAGEELGGASPPQDARRRTVITHAPVTWRKHRICLVSSLRWICRRPHWQVGAKRAGSPRTPHRCICLFLETGPRVLNRICEDLVVGGNSAQHRFVDCSGVLGLW
jgi:hypothetical protein